MVCIYKIIYSSFNNEKFASGQCEVASKARLSANIARKSDYNQHMTIGLFKGLKLPKEVLNNQTGYKKILAEEYLDINLLTRVEAHLIGGNLLKWELIFSSERGKTHIFLSLSQGEQKIENFRSTSKIDSEKLDVLLTSLWDNCYTVYEFVLSTNYVLESRDSLNTLKNNLIEIIVNITNLL